jgi:hypothetical protein
VDGFFFEQERDCLVKITINSVNEKSNLSVAPAITSTKPLTGCYWKKFSVI